jgi:hypothetical protein
MGSVGLTTFSSFEQSTFAQPGLVGRGAAFWRFDGWDAADGLAFE